jgi:hypothetical protein
MLLEVIKVELFADYFQIIVQDENAEQTFEWLYSENDIERLLTVLPGTIIIGTVRNMDVPLTIKLYDIDPGILSDLETIGQINECDIEVKSNKLIVMGSSDYQPDALRIELINGLYRARIYYGNLEEISIDGLDGEDFYEIHLWHSVKNRAVEIIKSRNLR